MMDYIPLGFISQMNFNQDYSIGIRYLTYVLQIWFTDYSKQFILQTDESYIFMLYIDHNTIMIDNNPYGNEFVEITGIMKGHKIICDQGINHIHFEMSITDICRAPLQLTAFETINPKILYLWEDITPCRYCRYLMNRFGETCPRSGDLIL